MPKAGCAEAERPVLELYEQREQTPKADCVEAERPALELRVPRE